MEKTKTNIRSIELKKLGQSLWLDYISRDLIRSGRLKKMIEEEGLLGVTTNPTIFDKAISGTASYDQDIKKLAQADLNALEIYDELTVGDVQEAADIFREVFEKTGGTDGYISLETLPAFAYDTEKTIQDVKRLARKVNRPNVMFKVPGTPQGLVAIQSLIGSGININVTLIFSPTNYEAVAGAYLGGLADLDKTGGKLSQVASVASYFVSRIDTVVDKKLDELISKETNSQKKSKLEALKGQAAVASCRVTYRRFKNFYQKKEFKRLEAKGARIQRLLWGSTSTKNPLYNDLKYVDNIIGKNTVNTLPENTYQAFLDHGQVRLSVEEDLSQTQAWLGQLEELGINLERVYENLQKEGVEAFQQSFDSLVAHLENKRKNIKH